ncbi:Serine/threonine-protein kinase PrkC [Anatilimnocola aggregata]|uniref:non-specific serine/threonine protein kinase n=1 Tax=Anatilimnocola aggregata TaxID=2528021 RepID=A0A517YFW0_9BACT|nr:WD40 repeat domain-containing serine/threonine protein kinase [Anatilimnocola aggregata]QDU29109.1 Serine/threonine-protein kinase PrkC [Anatilimnocola aggregata]
MADLQTLLRWNLDERCDHFESEWKSGQRPSLSEYLAGWNESGADQLFRHLLELEVDYRERAGETVVGADYHPHFPNFQTIIDEVIAGPSVTKTYAKRQADTRPRATAPTAETPASLGGYELLELLGQGGMGVVYKARQISLNRLVALKMIRSGELADNEELRRFRAEAEAAAKLEHAGIVPVFEVGEDRGRLFFSMGLVEGGSLDGLLANDPPDIDHAVRLLEQTARAVGYAHERGIIHRDLKPANILIDRAGAPRITDFGLAKSLHADQELTTTGQVLGTPSYMPPEQARGEASAICPASDVYSLGAVLYRTLAGRTPFQAATLVDMLHEVVNAEPVAPSRLVRGISPDLDTICLKCLEKAPARRYTSANDFADELARYLRREPILARPISRLERGRRWCSRNPVIASLLAVVAVSLLLGTAISSYFGYAATLSAAAARTSATKARDAEKLAETRRKEQEREAERAKAATALAQERERVNRERLVGIYVNRGWESARSGDLGAAWLFQAEAYRLDAEAAEAAAREASTSDAAAYESAKLEYHRIRLGQLQGAMSRVPVVVAHQKQVKAAKFLPGDQQFVTIGADGIAQVWNAQTGEAIGAPMKHNDAVECVAVSGDGTIVATGDVTGVARTWDAATGLPISPELKHKGWVLAVAIDRDGKSLLTGSGGNQARLFDTRSGAPLMEPLIESADAAGQVRLAAFSGDGKRFFTAIRGADGLRVHETASGELLTPPIVTGGDPNTAQLSPDGQSMLMGFRWGGIRLFDVVTGKDLFPTIQVVPIGNGLGPMTIDFKDDGSRFIVGCNNFAQVYVTYTGKPEGSPITLTADVTHVSYRPGSEEVLLADQAGQAYTYSLRERRPTSAVFQHGGSIATAEFSADGKQILTASLDGTARVWNLSSPQLPISRVATPASIVTSELFADGETIALACSHQVMHFFDLPTSKLLPQELKCGTVELLAVRPDGQQIITVSPPDPSTLRAVVQVWNRSEQGAWQATPLHNVFASVINYLENGQQFQICGGSTVKSYDSSTLELIVDRPLGSLESRTMVLHGKTKRALSANGGNVFLRDVETWKEIVPPCQHGADVEHLCFSPDGRNAVSSGRNSQVCVWDTTTGKLRFPPLEHPRIHWGARYLAYSPDGTLLATGGEDGVARVWDATTGKPLTPPIAFQQSIVSLRFTTNSRILLVSALNEQTAAYEARTGLPLSNRLPFSGKLFSPGAGHDAYVAGKSNQVVHWKFAPLEMNHSEAVAMGQLYSLRQLDNTGSLVQMPLPEWSRLRKEYQAKFPDLFRESGAN